MKLRVVALVSMPTLFGAAGMMVACGDDTIVTGDDAGFDGATNDVDAERPIEDAGVADAKPDVLPPKNVAEFATRVEDALCGSLTRCCFGDAKLADGTAVDGGVYDKASCAALYKDIGFEFSSTGAHVVDGGEVVVDDAKSVDCLDAVEKLACALTGTDMTTVRAACFDALVGTRTAGEDCRGSIECARGHYCDPGTQKCALLKAEDEPCSIVDTGSDEVDSVKSEEACSWRGSGDTKLRCDSYDITTWEYRPRSEWKCKPQVELGEICNSTVWCKDSICDAFNGYICASPVEIFTNYCGRALKD